MPRAVAGLSGVSVRSVAAGLSHTLAVSEEGAVHSFGNDAYGQLGHGDMLHQRAPRLIEALRGVRVTEAAAGHCHSLVVDRTGAAYTFGYGWYGQLGHGDLQHRTHDESFVLTPRRIEELKGVRVRGAAAGRSQSFVVSAAGRLYSFGNGQDRRIGHVEVSCQHTPRLIEALRPVRFSAVAAGEQHALALSEAGEVYSFGDGAHGQLGHGETIGQTHSSPRRVETLRGVRITAVAAGRDHSLALGEAGEVYSFGGGLHGQLGHGCREAFRSEPRAIAGLRGVRSIAAGAATSLAVDSSGRAWGWGVGARHELGWGMAAGTHPVLGLELAADQHAPLKYPDEVCLRGA